MVKKLSGKDVGAREKKKMDDGIAVTGGEGSAEQEPPRKMTRKERRGQRFRERKAQEAQAASQATVILWDVKL